VRVLLTNDDGVRSAGISAIRAALTGVCTSVVTVAPAADCSGFARKGTFDRPVLVQRLEGGSHPVYECDGTPTDCVRAGLLGGLAAETDLVVSGINHGANVADDVVSPGTGPGQRVYPRAPVKDWDTDPGPWPLYPIGGPDEIIPEAGGQADSDIAALRRGLISVTPLSVAIGLGEVSPR
jgi:broad specificity polyphosphatase/5'/3'-nucleotidase SurE